MGVGRVPAGYQRLPLSYAGQVALPLTIAHQCGQYSDGDKLRGWIL